MYELNMQQTEDVGGGWVIPVLALIVGTIALGVTTVGNLDELGDFKDGLKDGFNSVK
jgi:hypothetical protein